MSYLYQFNIVVNDKERSEEVEREIANLLENAIKDNDYVEIVGSQIVELDNEICGKCTCCGAWTSNQDNEECVSSFSDGCCIDGKWLCDICLPSEHPKSF